MLEPACVVALQADDFDAGDAFECMQDGARAKPFDRDRSSWDRSRMLTAS